MAKTILKVTGMTCGHCVNAVTSALKNTAGVAAADVDLSTGRATVEFDESQTNVDELSSAVAAEGYEAEVAA